MMMTTLSMCMQWWGGSSDICNFLEIRVQLSLLRNMLDLLVHASECRHKQCMYLNCQKVKGIFRHGIQCKVRAYGGCMLCKKMWHLIQLHARACEGAECYVPRCRDLKDHFKRLQEQSDTRRRASVMEMIRQKAAEATVLSKTGHLSVAEAVLGKMDEDYYYVAGVVVEKMGHLSVAEAVLDTMDAHHSMDDEWICV
ncbi:hypothetical protein MKW92_007561 [Papaver armeniacum]|nr:hypothetical protein MKW92_007561 [Papaver armeniacum]